MIIDQWRQSARATPPALHRPSVEAEASRGVAKQSIAKKDPTRKWEFGQNFGQEVLSTGAPWLMKMGTIASLWHYDAAAQHAL